MKTPVLILGAGPSGLAARNVLENKGYNIDNAGSEQEYFEKGRIK